MPTHSGEAAAIKRTDAPLTHRGICEDLARIGLASGDLLLLHTGMSRLGWVCGGEQSVLQAVLDVLGDSGTLVTPGFSSQLSDPGNWSDPPVPEFWRPTIRDSMPVFDKAKSPTRGIGRVPEAFRKWPGTERSDHPGVSFLARGPLAGALLADHTLADTLGPKSPLGRMHDHDAKVLLLGAGYDACSCFHLAEHDLPGSAPQTVRYPASVVNGRTLWTTAQEPQSYEQHFPCIGAVLDAQVGAVRRGFGGSARCFGIRDAVAVARHWFTSADPALLQSE